MSSGDGLDFQNIRKFTRSLTQNIVINHIKVSDGKRINADNVVIVALTAFIETVKKRCITEDMIKKFRNGVDQRRKHEFSFSDLRGVFFCKRMFKSDYSPTSGEYDMFKLSSWRRYLLRNIDKPVVTSFMNMFSYEYFDVSDSKVLDTRISYSEMRSKIVAADVMFNNYCDQKFIYPDDNNGKECLSEEDQYMIELRDFLVAQNDIEGLEELAALSVARFKAKHGVIEEAQREEREKKKRELLSKESKAEASKNSNAGPDDNSESDNDSTNTPSMSFGSEEITSDSDDSRVEVYREDEIYPTNVAVRNEFLESIVDERGNIQSDRARGVGDLRKILRNEDVEVQGGAYEPILDIGGSPSIQRQSLEVKAKDLVPVKGYPQLLFQEGVNQDQELKIEEWISAMVEFKNMSIGQEESQRDHAERNCREHIFRTNDHPGSRDHRGLIQ
jgi:hypothetical protein